MELQYTSEQEDSREIDEQEDNHKWQDRGIEEVIAFRKGDIKAY